MQEVLVAAYTSSVTQATQASVSHEIISTLDVSLDILETTFDRLSRPDTDHELLVTLMPSIFLHAHLLPMFMLREEVDEALIQSRTQSVAEKMWSKWVGLTSVKPSSKDEVTNNLHGRLRAFVWDVNCSLL